MPEPASVASSTPFAAEEDNASTHKNGHGTTYLPCTYENHIHPGWVSLFSDERANSRIVARRVSPRADPLSLRERDSSASWNENPNSLPVPPRCASTGAPPPILGGNRCWCHDSGYDAGGHPRTLGWRRDPGDQPGSCWGNWIACLSKCRSAPSLPEGERVQVCPAVCRWVGTLQKGGPSCLRL